MAKPIYKLFMMKFTEAWYQLSDDEQNRLFAKQQEGMANAGVKNIIGAESAWSSEECQFFGVHEYPDFEALENHNNALIDMQWFRYVDSKVILGKEWEGS